MKQPSPHSNCCHDDHLLEPDPRDKDQRRILKVVLAIHSVMFIASAVGGWLAGSTVIMAESVDFLSHVFLLALSLFAAHHGSRWIARASLGKGITMFLVGASVLVDAAKRLAEGGAPHAETIGAIGVLGIIANLASMALLKKFGTGELNTHSSYLCSRNDVLTHIGIVVTSVLVATTGSRLPDTLVGCALSILIIRSALHVTRRSVRMLRTGQDPSFKSKTSQAGA
jgi:Co/Zn/Cd efflux system component